MAKILRVEFLLLLLLVFAVPMAAQPGQPALIYVSTDPSGACGNGIMQYNYVTGNFWGCENGLWTLVSGSAGGGGGQPPPVPGYPANQLISGCGVQYTTGLSFTVGACTYTIGGQTYTSPITTLTLTNADGTNPRIDLIIVSTNSTASVLTGTAATPALVPNVDPTTQLQVTAGLTVAANASTPSGVAATTIYDETGGAEWTGTCSSNLTCNSTNNPYHLTKDIEATAAVITNNVSLVKPAAGTVDLATQNALVFYLRSKATWPTGGGGSNAARMLSVTWQNGSTQKGNAVVVRDGTFGFSSATTNAYQQISIPTSLFAINGTAVTTLVITVSGASGTSSIGFYIDWITLQSGVGQGTLPTTSMNFRGTWASTTAYSPNDVVVSSGVGYVALAANTNVAVTTTATWAALAPNTSTAVIALFTGCSGTQYLGADGACHTAGSGTGCTQTKYTITQSPFGTTWTVTGQSGQSVTASTTTQTINIVTLASKSVINYLRVATTTKWAGTSMTNITMSLGTNASGGSTTSFEPAFTVGGTSNTLNADSPFGACTATCPTYLDDGGSFSGADNGETVTATFISTGGNLTAMTAGSEDVTLCVSTLP